jgi:hypothetical protein
MLHLTRFIRTRPAFTPSDSTLLWRKAAVTTIGALALACLAVPSHAASDGHRDPTSDQVVQAQQICEAVIHIRFGDGHFDGCVSSLADSLQSATRYHAVENARNACFARGFRPNSPDLSLCLLQAAVTNPGSYVVAPTMSPRSMASEGLGPDFSGPDFPASLDVVLRREQQACARVGFDPAFAAFETCVADLQVALQRIDLREN